MKITRRKVLFTVGLIVAAFGLVLVVSSGCASRKITTVSMSYATVTNKVALLRPTPGSSGIQFGKEVEPGTKFMRWMREPGGDVKFGPYTTVYVTKVNERTTTVELTTGRHSLLLFGHYRHLFFRERAKWRELQEILRNDAS